MAYSSRPSMSRKASGPWDRLRPVKQDPLESMGYVSKGDNRLLDLKTQESYYNKIVARYMQFCSQYSKNLDSAFAALSLSDKQSPKSSSTIHPADGSGSFDPTSTTTTTSTATAITTQSSNTQPPSSRDGPPLPSTELTIILQALRKLREGLLASSSNAPSPVFSQRVHVFNIRLAILAYHPESYHPPLLHLLSVLHTSSHPLPRPELNEFLTYLILDLALRQSDLVAAYTLRHTARHRYNYTSRTVDDILRSLVTNNFISFWRIRRRVDGHIRALMYWEEEKVRKRTLKAFGRTYLNVDVKWVLKCCSGGEWEWEELVEREGVGWVREGDRVVVRKVREK